MYFAGLWEQTTAGARTLYYSFNGQGVAMRNSAGVTYLHGDHLGSISLATNSSGAIVSQQEFDPWGKVLHRDHDWSKGSTATGPIESKNCRSIATP